MNSHQRHARRFNPDLLPSPKDYYCDNGIHLHGSGEWQQAVCPFHRDTNPSLGIKTDTGGFYCHACGASGGNIIDFHMQRHGLSFESTVTALGAWEQYQPTETDRQRHQERQRARYRDAYQFEWLVAKITQHDREAGRPINAEVLEREKVAKQRMHRIEKLFGGHVP